VLRLLLTLGETSAPYNELSLPCRHRHDITLCTLFDPTVETPPELRVFSGGGSVTGFLGALRRALRADAYDVVHANSPHVAFLFLALALFGRGAPPAVYTLHTSYPNVKWRNLLLLLPVLAGFQRIVCCSQASLDSFPPLLRRLGGSRLRAIPNGVDLARVDRALARCEPARLDRAPARCEPARLDRDPARRGAFRVVCVGRLMALKDPLGVLEAFAEASAVDSRLRFVGEGPLQTAVAEAARAAGLETRVELRGLVPRDAVYAELAAADLFVSASRCEGLPVAALEAMACRVPVVLSDIPPHREIAAGADFVPLVAPGDTRGFAREIRRIREMPDAERRTLGERCRRLVEERFGLERMVRLYESVFAEAATGAPAIGAPTPGIGDSSR
jgi:glycosyltransferase involved in cell wall biosynthesis